MAKNEGEGLELSLEDLSFMSIPLETFCALPFGHLFLSEEGKSFPCCYALESGEANRDENGKEVFVKERLEEAWNCHGQRKMRQQMLKGEKPEACKRCFQVESHGLQSLREISNREFLAEGWKAAASIEADGSLPMHFFSADLRLGNHCNLRCQMCSPISSRKMIQDFALLYPGSEERFRAYESVDWFADKKVLQALLHHADSLRELHFAGGEPFLIPEVKWTVEEMSKKAVAKHCRLSFNSNLTLLPESLLQKGTSFESVRLVVSLDGVGEVNDYIRFPSKFSQIHENLCRLQEKQKEWNIPYVCFNVTVQIHNIFHLPALIRYISSFPGFIPFPVLGPLHVPEALSLQVLPTDVKERARNLLLTFIEEERTHWRTKEGQDPVPDGAKRFEERLLGLVEFMMAADRSDLLPEFYRYTSVVEKIRAQTLSVSGL